MQPWQQKPAVCDLSSCCTEAEVGAGRVGHGRGKGLVQQDSVYPVVGGLRERSGNSEGVRLLYTEIQLRKKKTPTCTK